MDLDMARLTAPELLELPVGKVFPRDQRVMTGKAGDAMMRLPNGWMVGPRAALEKHAFEDED